jgi:hopanoid biosynthesis associated protein HpnK
MRKTLIINGDDFGLSAATNAGIVRAHTEGVLTATSLMVTGEARNEALTAAQQYPSLDVGLHLVFCDGLSVLPAERLRGVVDSAGRFAGHEVPAGFRYWLNPRLRDALRDECRAQIETHLRLVGYLNHIDGHRNLHLHPVLIDILGELAPEYRVPYVRVVREPLATTLAYARDRLGFKLIDATFFSLLSARAARRLKARGVGFTDSLFGFLQTGRLNESYVCSVIAALPPGSFTEFYFHPVGEANGSAGGKDKPANHETEILTSPRVQDAIAKAGVTLTNFAAIAQAQRPSTATPADGASRW